MNTVNPYTLNTPTRRTSFPTRPARALAWAVGLAVSAASVLAQSPGANNDDAASRPNVSVENAEGVAVVRLNFPGGAVSTTGYYQFVENGRKIELTLKNDAVTEVKIDGEAIPSERAALANDKVTIKDADGKVLFEHQFDSDDAGLTARAQRSTLWADAQGQDHLRQRYQARVAEPAAEPPKVMLGVQMIGVPDVLRGHLGLERGSGIMVSAVHEGLPAANAGLKPYDIILSAGDNPKVDESSLRAMLRDLNPGQSLEMSVIQKGETKKLSVTLEAYDAAKLEAAKAESISAMDPYSGPEIAYLQDLSLMGVPGQPGVPGAPVLPPDVAHLIGPDAKVWSWSSSDPNFSPDFEERLNKIMEQALERARAAQGMHGQAQADAERTQADMHAAQEKMRERMERMEKMLEEMMRQQQKNAADEKQS